MENKNEQVEQVQWEVQTLDRWAGSKDQQGEGRSPQLEVKRELLSSIGLFIGTGLLGFWFGVGATSGAKMINSLEELIRR